MELVDGLGYVALTVPDLERSVDFYQRIGHLRVTERGTKTAFLSGGSEHHWLRLDEGDAPGLTRIAFELTGRAAIDEVVDRLDAIGVAWKPVDDLPGERVVDAIRFRDPDGFEIELFVGHVSLPVRVETFVNMDRFLHAVWLVSNPVESAQFYRDVLGFKDSDWIERIAVFMRSANRYHHSAGILLGGEKAGQLDHFCILVDDLDDVMRARNVALSNGVELRQDLVRHAASGSVSTYLMDPVNDIAVEFCAWHCQIDDEEYQPRTLQASPSTLDLWKASPDGGVIVASYAEQAEEAEDAMMVSDLMA
jgi:2,3-dihydroxy-p-cumate/2,3-dihydroxybenzoate 3,4-dioxygenase